MDLRINYKHIYLCILVIFLVNSYFTVWEWKMIFYRETKSWAVVDNLLMSKYPFIYWASSGKESRDTRQ